METLLGIYDETTDMGIAVLTMVQMILEEKEKEENECSEVVLCLGR